MPSLQKGFNNYRRVPLFFIYTTLNYPGYGSAMVLVRFQFTWKTSHPIVHHKDLTKIDHHHHHQPSSVHCRSNNSSIEVFKKWLYWCAWSGVIEGGNWRASCGFSSSVFPLSYRQPSCKTMMNIAELWHEVMHRLL